MVFFAWLGMMAFMAILGYVYQQFVELRLDVQELRQANAKAIKE